MEFVCFLGLSEGFQFTSYLSNIASTSREVQIGLCRLSENEKAAWRTEMEPRIKYVSLNFETCDTFCAAVNNDIRYTRTCDFSIHLCREG
jgi:hypothetical protein